MGAGDWGLGTGDWGLGTGELGAPAPGGSGEWGIGDTSASSVHRWGLGMWYPAGSASQYDFAHQPGMREAGSTEQGEGYR
ncbi:MAG: hypothetical protein KME21_01970 [Desmonostoc vinosum HA7617-LM4]|nr:hypothetical protein [Desmonostoc vinosum HA7617-LM4]